MARLVIDLPEISPGWILFSGPGVRLPASVGLGAAAGLRANSPQAHANPSWNAT
jgi:hypothetical protein